MQQVLEPKLRNATELDELSVCSRAHTLTGQVRIADIIKH